MLSGLILSATLLVLVSMLMVPAVSNMAVSEDERRYRFLGYMMLAAERLVVPLKPDNAGGGKEPQFKNNVAKRRVRRVV